MKTFILALAAMVATPVSADTIDFSSLGFDGGAGTAFQSYTSVVVGDYVFTALQPGSTPLLVHARSDPNNADQGGATLGLTTSGSALGFEFARVDGTAFDFTGFQVTHFTDALTSPGNGGTLALMFDGVQVFAPSYDIFPGFQDVAVSALGVRNVRITSNNFFQVDNLIVSSGVPEPATWLAMSLGFGLVAGRLRWRRRPAPVVVG